MQSRPPARLRSTAPPRRCCARRAAGRRLSVVSRWCWPARCPIRLGQYRQRRLQPAEHRVRVVFDAAGRRSAAAAATAGRPPRRRCSAAALPGDRAMSRGSSSEALRNYRASQQPPPSYAPPTCGSRSYAPSPASSGGGWLPGGGWGAAMPRRAPSWGGGWDTVSPRRSFGTGVVTGVALWAALNALSSSPSQAEYFYAHRNDPAYREWRQEAESARRARPRGGRQTRRTRSPHGAARRTAGQHRWRSRRRARTGARGARAGSRSGASSSLSRGIILILFWLWRRARRSPARWRRRPAPGLAGSAESRFRVGMVLPVDPAPFLLAAGLTKIQPPDESGRVSVEAVGLLRYGNVLLHRLYLPGGRAFFQLHLGADGRPDECRYFSQIDEVTPANPQEWGFWLDPNEGLIGWPTFPDQGRQALRTGLGARSDPHRAAPDRGDQAIRRSHRAPPPAGDAVRGADRRRGCRAADRVHPGQRDRRRRARPGSKSMPASTSTRRHCSCRASLLTRLNGATREHGNDGTGSRHRVRRAQLRVAGAAGCISGWCSGC